MKFCRVVKKSIISNMLNQIKANLNRIKALEVEMEKSSNNFTNSHINSKREQK